MTTDDFRSDKNECIELSKMIESRTFKKALEAAAGQFDAVESYTLSQYPDGSDKIESRFINQRKGRFDLIAALKLMCIPLQSSPPVPEMTYGADEAVEKLKEQGAWVPVDQP